MSYETVLSLICSNGTAADVAGYAGGDGYSRNGATGTIYQSLYGPLVPWVFDFGVGAVIYFTMPICSWPPLNEDIITNLALQTYGTLVTQFGGLKSSVSFDSGNTWHSIGVQGGPFNGNIDFSAYNVTLAELSNVMVAFYIGSTEVGPSGCGPNCSGSSYPLYGCVCPPDTFTGGVQLVVTSSSPLEFAIEPTIVITEECCCVCA